jgi:heme-degrading monooxygenase HmoA
MEGRCTQVILRIFEGLIAAGCEAEFHQIVRQHGLPELASAPGCLSATFARAVGEEGETFTVVSVWSDWDSLSTWTGGQPQQVVYYQGRQDLLARSSIRLFEVVDSVGSGPLPADSNGGAGKG